MDGGCGHRDGGQQIIRCPSAFPAGVPVRIPAPAEDRELYHGRTAGGTIGNFRSPGRQKTARICHGLLAEFSSGPFALAHGRYAFERQDDRSGADRAARGPGGIPGGGNGTAPGADRAGGTPSGGPGWTITLPMAGQGTGGEQQFRFGPHGQIERPIVVIIRAFLFFPRFRQL